MPAIKLEQFGGMLPAWDPHLLPTGQAAQSVNGYLFSGALQGWRQPKKLRNLTNSAAKYAYRVPTVSETQALAYLVFPAQPLDGDQITLGDLTYTYKAILPGQAVAFMIFKAQPSNGDTFTVGTDVYTWRTVLSTGPTVPFEVLIGANTLLSAVNAVAAITLDYTLSTTIGVKYSTGTTLNTATLDLSPPNCPPGLDGCGVATVVLGGVSYTYMLVGAPAQGVTYNTTPVAESTGNVRTTWVKDLAFADLTTTFQGGGDPPASAAAAEILIGANTLATAVNTVAALTVDYGLQTNSGVLYSKNTTINNAIVTTNPAATLPGLSGAGAATVNIAGTNYSYVIVGAPDFGASYNATNVSETTGNARTTWLKDLLSFADTTLTFAGGTNPSFANNIAGAATWLEFVDQDTNVLKSQVADDKFDRFYIASPSQEPQYNTRARIVAGKPAWNLGIPAPGCAPTVAVTGGGSTLTLGNVNTDSTQPDVFSVANTIYLIPITPTGATQVNDVQFGVDGNGQAFTSLGGHPPIATITNFAAVLYGDTNGAPGTLLNTGSIVTGLVAGNNTSQFLTPSPILPGTQYWVGIIIDQQVPFLSPSPAASNVTSFTQAFTSGPPPTAPTSATPGQPAFQMFADCISSDVLEARAYLYTWVSAYGEEGPPSAATLFTGWSNGNWTITAPDAARGRSFGDILRNLAVLRLYRTVTAVGGSSVYFWVADISLGSTDPDAVQTIAAAPLIPAAFTNGLQSSMPTGVNPPAATYVDTNPDNLVALTVQMPSTVWFPPPGNLQGLVSLPNGMMAGWIGNSIWFCEPYQSHAWPPGYVLTVDFPIVGLGVSTGSLIVCTGARPYVINGVSPGNMSMFKCSKAEPCLSRGSILDGAYAVAYMSPNGLIEVTSSGQVSNTTQLWITRERWENLTPSAYARAISLASCYVCFGSTSPLGVVPADNSQAQTGFAIELDDDSKSFTIWPQPGGHRLGFDQLTSPNGFNIDNVLTDPWTGIGMLIQNQAIYYYDFTDQAPTMTPYTWTSKVYHQNTKKSYEAMKVFFTQPAGPTGPAYSIPVPFGATLPTGTTGFTGPAGNTGPNQAPATDTSWNTLQPGQLGIIKTFVDLYDNGQLVLVDCREITGSGDLLRIVSGFKAEQWMWQISGRILISNAQIATTAKELANV